MSKELKNKVYKVYEDQVTTVYENGIPVSAIYKINKHDVVFTLKENHGSATRDLLQNITMQAELLESKTPMVE